MSPLENALRNDVRTQRRLNHSRDAAAAEAAIAFFARGRPSSNDRWYGSETWQQIMEAFIDADGAGENGWRATPAWRPTSNNDPGSLRIEFNQLYVGQIIEIENDKSKRYITSTMGNAERGTFHVHFKNQGAVPTDYVRWRLLATRELHHDGANKSPGIKISNDGSPFEATNVNSPEKGRKLDTTSDKPEQLANDSLADRIKKHPIASLLALLVTAVISLAAFVTSVDQITTYITKYLDL